MQNDIPTIAVIVPVRNEAARIGDLLHCLQAVRNQVLLVDGDSSDETIVRCEQAGFKVILSSPGRALQMNTGAKNMQADCYWFLHADCLPPDDAIEQIKRSCQQGALWGRFDVQLTGRRWIFRLIECLMNWRSCITQVATGDQGIFVTRALFEKVGGFPEQPLMEDVEISKRLRQYGRCACIKSRMVVSSRRWESHGIYQTIFLMWWLRLRYVLGAAPVELHRTYYGSTK